MIANLEELQEDEALRQRNETGKISKCWLRVTDRRMGLDFCQCYGIGTDDELAKLAWGFLKAGMSVEVI